MEVLTIMNIFHLDVQVVRTWELMAQTRNKDLVENDGLAINQSHFWRDHSKMTKSSNFFVVIHMTKTNCFRPYSIYDFNNNRMFKKIYFQKKDSLETLILFHQCVHNFLIIDNFHAGVHLRVTGYLHLLIS